MNKLEMTSGMGLEGDMLANSVLLPRAALDTAAASTAHSGLDAPRKAPGGPNRMAKSGAGSM